MLEGALDVQDVRSAPCSTTVATTLTDDADERDDQDDPALDRGRLDQPPDALVDDQQAEHQQRRAVELGREDLGPLEAVGHRARGRPRGQPQRHQRQRERARVGEHVRRVAEQRQRGGEDAEDDLDRHQADEQAERDPQAARRRVGRGVRVPGAVVVVVVVAHAMNDGARGLGMFTA